MNNEYVKRELTESQIERIRDILNENYKHEESKIWMETKPVSSYYPKDKEERVLGYEFIIYMEK